MNMKITNTQYTEAYRSYTKIKADYSLHQHEHVELLYVAEGHLNCMLGQTAITLRQNQCLLLFPYTPHLIYEPEDNSAQILKILFAIDFLDDFKKIFYEYTLNDAIFDFDELEEGSRTALNWLMKTAEQESSELPPQIPRGWLTVLLGDFFYKRVLEKKKEAIDPVLLKNLFQYLNTNRQQDLTLQHLATELGVSQYFLSNMLAQVLNTTFHTLLHSTKIAHSKDLLCNTSLNLLDIALDCGYQNTKTFSRNFKEQTGMTPMQYRKEH